MARWIEANGLDPATRWPFTKGLLALVAYIAAVVAGSALQSALDLGWSMGWLQQAAGAAMALLVAALLGRPASLLGLKRPNRPWLPAAIGAGLAIAACGMAAARLLPPETRTITVEYLAYQATAPGIGEELGMRGVWLALLAVALLRVRWLPWPRFTVLMIAAVPFAALHLLERQGFELVVVASFTLFAGMVFGWLRLGFGSVLPAIVAHNVANVAPALVRLAFPSG